MALPVIAAAAAGTALAAYLDAKFLIRNDLNAASSFGGARQRKQLVERAAQDKVLLYNYFEDRSKTEEGNNLFLEFEGQKWTYKQFFEDLQPVGNWLMNDLGIQRGEMVALHGPNSPEWVKIWLALEAIGATPCFINFNLTGKALQHCVQLCEPRYLISDATLRSLSGPCEPDFKAANIKTVEYDPSFLASLADHTPLPASRRSKISPKAVSSLSFTSGTTGLPKGTVKTFFREFAIRQTLLDYLKLKPSDKMYTCLPLYHTAALGLCFRPCIGSGCAIVLSRKFSHHTFWPEVRASDANIMQYVGELPRYLLNAPPSPLDKSHNITMAWGNGMRPDVWEPFRQRFNIPCIHELYASSDGIASSFNKNYGPFGRNAIAVRGLLWDLMNSANEKHIKIDPDTQDVIRDSRTGFCVPCQKGEVGELITRVDPANPNERFPGYFKNQTASDKRYIRNVLEKGDMWFRAGDLLRRDPDGCLYFVDRMGDTFRWHSENVSTGEVEEVISRFPQIQEANVYGVLVPNADGRAGCAAIVPNGPVEDLDFSGLAEHALKLLPRYAVPLFVRITKEMGTTGNFKVQKGTLREEGMDLGKIQAGSEKAGKPADAMYWLPPGQSKYVPFRERDLQEVRGGRVKL